MPVKYADPEEGCLADLVDLDRYPLPLGGLTRSAKYLDLVRSAQKQLEEDGLVQLKGFIHHQAVAEAQEEMRSLAGLAQSSTDDVSVYGRDTTLGHLEPGDPRTTRQPRRVAHLTRDMFGPQTVAHRMYASPALKRFIADCMGEPRVYEFADPLAGLIATVIEPNGVLPWHYDTNDFVVTLMIDGADTGGHFEYIPNLRQPGNENLSGLAQVLNTGVHPTMQRPQISPGDLQIFRGHYSLHRVSEVGPGRARNVVVFGYAAEPGVISPLDRTRAVYGRVTEAHLLAHEASAGNALGSDGLIR